MARRAIFAACLVGCVVALLPQTALADAVHVVAPGENLFRIAFRYGTTVGAIVRANRLPSADLIYAGQRLFIPSPQSVAPGPGTAGGGALQPSQIHVVARGETLGNIALRYGTTVSELVRVNGLASPNRIYAGQRLLIPSARRQLPPSPGSGPVGTGRRIVVDLSSQTLTAWEGSTLRATFLVSTGKPATPTPVGSYRIYARYRSQTMSGPGYRLPGVPYVQYFHGGYALHGTYWHSSFGVPVTHGCVNLRTDDAAWLWDWASIGTPVIVQP